MKGRVQLWSSHYAPEPTGIGPVSRILATSLTASDWEVEVIAAQPHYPDPSDHPRLRPSRELRDGIPVLRFPIYSPRGSAGARLLQESTYSLGLLASLPLLGRPPLPRPDVMVAASPSFLSLLPAMLAARTQGAPLVLWLHDLLPDGAATTGLLEAAGPMLKASRWLERAAYDAAERIVVLSSAFRDNLAAKGVPREKVELIYHPATLSIATSSPAGEPGTPPRVLSMGNIGLSQGLAPLVRAFEASREMSDRGVVLTITGSGVAATEVRAEIRSERTRMPGVVDEAALLRELNRSDLALVSQSFDGSEFNLPSKLMNFMGRGLPVIAAVNPGSEVAGLVRESGAGWVVDSSRPELFPQAIAEALDRSDELAKRGTAGRDYAARRFSPDAFAASFDRVLSAVVGPRS
jgi:putative colanic acid biosynthesis glycosyltransferase WcaI